MSEEKPSSEEKYDSSKIQKLEGLEGVRRARPRWLWPVDALVLAESLLLG